MTKGLSLSELNVLIPAHLSTYLQSETRPKIFLRGKKRKTDLSHIFAIHHELILDLRNNVHTRRTHP